MANGNLPADGFEIGKSHLLVIGRDRGRNHFCVVLDFTMKRLGIDAHSAAGAGGLVATVFMTHYNEVIAGIAGTATAAYMVLRAAREWIKFRRDEKEKSHEKNPDTL